MGIAAGHLGRFTGNIFKSNDYIQISELVKTIQSVRLLGQNHLERP